MSIPVVALIAGPMSQAGVVQSHVGTTAISDELAPLAIICPDRLGIAISVWPGGIADDPHPGPRDPSSGLRSDWRSGLLMFVVDARVGLHPSDSRGRRSVTRASCGCSSPTRSTIARDGFHSSIRSASQKCFRLINGKNSGDLLTMLARHRMEADRRCAGTGSATEAAASIVRQQLLGESAGLRDRRNHARCVDTPMTYHGRQLIFVDTAGLRRRGPHRRWHRVHSSRAAVGRSSVLIFILAVDATGSEIQNQDLKIAALAWGSRPRPTRVSRTLLRRTIATAKCKRPRVKSAFLKFVPFLFTSAHSSANRR